MEILVVRRGDKVLGCAQRRWEKARKAAVAHDDRVRAN
jgi:hypothetical protein